MSNIELFAASKGLKSAARWRRAYEEALQAKSIRGVCSALNQLRRSVALSRDDIFAVVAVEAKFMAEVEAIARESSVEDVVEGAYTLAGGRLFRESERLFAMVPRENVVAHPDFVGLYASGAAMAEELRAVFQSLGIATC